MWLKCKSTMDWLPVYKSIGHRVPTYLIVRSKTRSRNKSADGVD